MTEVFITNIENKIQADKAAGYILCNQSGLIISFDFNETKLPFPCGHTILKVEGHKINSGEIIVLLNRIDIKCEILEDKICA